MRRLGWIVAAAVGLALTGAAQAQDPAAKPARPPYDVHKDPCGPVILAYCPGALSRMDHPAIHACLISHAEYLPNTCRSTMAMPRPPLRPEGEATPPIPPDAKPDTAGG